MKRFILVLLFSFFLTETVNAKLTVNTSLYLLSSIIKYIGQNRVDTSYVIPASGNPHLFSPTPKSLVNFEKAQLFVGIGCGLEFWFDRVAHLRNGKPNLFLCKYYKNPLGVMRVGGKFFANPHIWFDLKFMKNVAIPVIVKKMCQLDKKDCSLFRKKESSFIEELSRIIKAYIAFFKSHREVCFVDMKPAFEYLFKTMGRGSCGVVVKDESSMPRLGDLKNLIENCRCKKGVVVYIGNSHMAYSVAHLLNYKPVFLNPLGDPHDKRLNSYLKLLIFNLNQLKKAVRGW